MENAAFDSPLPTDYPYEAVFGSETDEGTITFIARVPRIQNQGAENVTRMACTRFGITHIVNSQNRRVAEKTVNPYVEAIAKDYWLAYLKTNPSAEENGASLQSALEQFRKAGLITGYAVANSVELMKDALRNYRLIYTGSMNGDWAKVRSEKKYALRTDGKTVGHAFCIVGYDRDGFVATNSYGPENGYFSIPYELAGTLFTRYAVADTKDEEAISLYRQRIMDNITIEDAKKALEAKIWNGLEPQKPATREEVAAMIYRATNPANN